MTARPRVHGSTALLALAAMLAACGGQPDASSVPPSPTSAVPTATVAPPSPTQSDGAPRDTSVFDLQVGDCFTAEGETLQSVGVVACEAPHVYEVFGLVAHEAGPGDAYPGDDELLRYADTACQPLFDDYVRADYQASIYWITSVTPSAETWEAGDREIICTLKLGEEGQETTGSAEGSGE